jgi:hypothetical protein
VRFPYPESRFAVMVSEVGAVYAYDRMHESVRELASICYPYCYLSTSD